MPYTPVATDGAAPVDGEKASTAALEFRTLKTYIQSTVVAGLASLTSALAGKAPLTGGGTSGTWGINITGNAATASAATTAVSASVAGSASSATVAGTADHITNSGYNGYGARTISTSLPSGGSDGDIWYQTV